MASDGSGALRLTASLTPSSLASSDGRKRALVGSFSLARFAGDAQLKLQSGGKRVAQQEDREQGRAREAGDWRWSRFALILPPSVGFPPFCCRSFCQLTSLILSQGNRPTGACSQQEGLQESCAQPCCFSSWPPQRLSRSLLRRLTRCHPPSHPTCRRMEIISIKKKPTTQEKTTITKRLSGLKNPHRR